ncbi:hypothetical protein HDU89_000972 [Geranomyces variabilis]|nr:hypothetical protein HDU89_000972 [Geranomyces variabilis]
MKGNSTNDDFRSLIDAIHLKTPAGPSPLDYAERAFMCIIADKCRKADQDRERNGSASMDQFLEAARVWFVEAKSCFVTIAAFSTTLSFSMAQQSAHTVDNMQVVLRGVNSFLGLASMKNATKMLDFWLRDIQNGGHTRSWWWNGGLLESAEWKGGALKLSRMADSLPARRTAQAVPDLAVKDTGAMRNLQEQAYGAADSFSTIEEARV